MTTYSFIWIKEYEELNIEEATGRFLNFNINTDAQIISLAADASLNSIKNQDKVSKEMCNLRIQILNNRLQQIRNVERDLEDEYK